MPICTISEVRRGSLGWPLVSIWMAIFAPGPALAQTMNRLKGVSQHARERSAEGPEHLWVGIGLAVALAVVVALAARWTLRRRRRP